MIRSVEYSKVPEGILPAEAEPVIPPSLLATYENHLAVLAEKVGEASTELSRATEVQEKSSVIGSEIQEKAAAEIENGGLLGFAAAMPVLLGVQIVKLAAEKQVSDAENRYTEASYDALLYRYLHDGLTGALNREGFKETLDSALTNAAIDEDPESKALIVMEFDADEFKGINDTLGHDAGDEVLRYIASLAESTARRSNRQGDGKDDIARVGGDEYYLVMQGVRTDLADAIVNHLRDKCSAFNVPYKNHEGSRDIPAGASIGAVVVPYVSVITSALDKDTSHVEIPEDFRQKIMDSVDKSLYKEKSRRKPYPPARGQKCYPDDSHLGLMW